MSLREISWQGEIYVSVGDAAACYDIEIVEIRRWIEAELVSPPRQIEGTEALPATELDRIAQLVRYTRLLGMDVETIHRAIVLGVL